MGVTGKLLCLETESFRPKMRLNAFVESTSVDPHHVSLQQDQQQDWTELAWKGFPQQKGWTLHRVTLLMKPSYTTT